MATQLVAVAALLLGSAFLLMGNGLHGLVLPLRGTVEGFTTIELGLLGTGWATGFIAACLSVPAMVRRVGHIRSYGALASLSAIAILLNLLIISPPAWIALRALSGFCFAGAAMIVESWMNERAGHDNRGTIFSVYQIVNFSASTTGQLVLAISPPTDYFYFILGAILYCLAILPTALSRAAMPQPLKTARLNLRRLYANSPISAVGCVLIGVVNGTFGTLGPVYGQQIGLPVSHIATLMAGSLLGGALIQFPLGWLSDRMDRRRVLLTVASVACVIGVAVATLQPRAPITVTSMVIVFGAMIYSMYSLTVAHANDYATGDDFVEIAGGLLLLYGIGTMIGPVIAAQTMNRLSPDGLFAFTAVVHLAMAAYTYFRISRRAPLAPVTRPAFHGLLLPKTVTPESATLDPRADSEVDPEGGGPVGS